jgi:alkyldihydroxyacetonephosphate synthase
MDRNIMADVSETSTVWSNLLPLYYSTINAIDQAIKKTVKTGFLGCHISHTYHTGASLYFTFGCRQVPGYELEQYLSIKKAAEDAFIQGGATLSHHHAVGFEHMPWIKDDISETGIKAIRGLKYSLDPNNIMNPDKIVPPLDKPFDWGLQKKDLENLESSFKIPK